MSEVLTELLIKTALEDYVSDIKNNDNVVTAVVTLRKVLSYADMTDHRSSEMIVFNVSKIGVHYVIFVSTISKDTSKVHHLTKHFFRVVFSHLKAQKLLSEKTVDVFIRDLMKKNKFSVKDGNMELFINTLGNCVKSIPDIYRFCPMCTSVKPTSTGYLKCCDKCYINSFGTVYSDVITELNRRDPNLFKLLLYTALEALKNKQRFMPVPVFCRSGTFEDDYLGTGVISYDMQYYVNEVDTADTDDDLRSHLKEREFMFLKHIVESNNTNLNYFDDDKATHRDTSVDIWDASSKRSMILFTIDHPTEKQRVFDSDVNPVHMFHGSGVHNWYSIMRNGLKNYSGTAMMTTGQVYGPGIYLGSDIATASGYCRNSGNTAYSVIGVVQLLNSAKYKKTNNIYVVPEEADVLLKYMIVFKNKNNEMQNTEKFLTQELPALVKTSVIGTNIIIAKRLQKEMNDLTKCAKQLKKRYTSLIDLALENCDKEPTGPFWKMKVTCRDSLKQDRDITFEVNIIISFPRTFPSSPFTIRCTTYDCDLSNVAMMIQTKERNVWSYEDPVMSRGRWRSAIRVYRVVEQMLINILSEQT